MSALVLHERQGPVAIVTLNRPQRHNSLVPENVQALLDVLAAIRPATRAVVLQANGRSFSTGGDALGFVQHADDVAGYAKNLVGLLNRAILAIMDLPVPVVAAVHGTVTGGALGFVLSADVVLLAPQASFTPYYSEVGPSPDGGWATLLPLVIGHHRAAEVLFCNETITAQEAVSWGLANRVVPADRIRQEALQVAQNIAAKKPGSIRHTKRLLHWRRHEISARLDAERERFVQHIETEEGIGGFRHFLAQRRAATEVEE